MSELLSEGHFPHLTSPYNVAIMQPTSDCHSSEGWNDKRFIGHWNDKGFVCLLITDKGE